MEGGGELAGERDEIRMDDGIVRVTRPEHGWENGGEPGIPFDTGLGVILNGKTCHQNAGGKALGRVPQELERHDATLRESENRNARTLTHLGFELLSDELRIEQQVFQQAGDLLAPGRSRHGLDHCMAAGGKLFQLLTHATLLSSGLAVPRFCRKPAVGAGLNAQTVMPPDTSSTAPFT